MFIAVVPVTRTLAPVSAVTSPRLVADVVDQVLGLGVEDGLESGIDGDRRGVAGLVERRPG